MKRKLLCLLLVLGVLAGIAAYLHFYFNHKGGIDVNRRSESLVCHSITFLIEHKKNSDYTGSTTAFRTRTSPEALYEELRLMPEYSGVAEDGSLLFASQMGEREIACAVRYLGEYHGPLRYGKHLYCVTERLFVLDASPEEYFPEAKAEKPAIPRDPDDINIFTSGEGAFIRQLGTDSLLFANTYGDGSYESYFVLAYLGKDILGEGHLYAICPVDYANAEYLK